ncbi:hypothetical protein OWV82_018631 [Melia azedarach]|uniref:Uncharacterized protein n=1 Tax=Melia azedarach TaxID=155640 RepID=A0ACC1XBU0_MELAZ|nr:hypothetical protein OWV82_018631 [Melia azedarach]
MSSTPTMVISLGSRGAGGPITITMMIMMIESLMRKMTRFMSFHGGLLACFVFQKEYIRYLCFISLMTVFP